ncbi:hypothetical protein HPB47_016452 [Ixodes persulcatus]|uniref:Uncharacterized protein n=1 Tax=Ixodes persulcatus TaxID=34615 RepID=A0AC60QTC3_IXOPE|nr:hypothetical protein HPB47_016452 [Ixodes persulcatus]
MWSERETWPLIRLWEDSLEKLRGEKHNAKVYDAIVGALAEIAIVKTRQQVQSKIDNLAQRYRAQHQPTFSADRRGDCYSPRGYPEDQQVPIGANASLQYATPFLPCALTPHLPALRETARSGSRGENCKSFHIFRSSLFYTEHD